MAQSAFIVRVPEAEPVVGVLRERFDPSARLGVPAHITLLYPFMAPEHITAADLDRVQTLAARRPAFDFRLGHIGRFPGCVYLAPEPAGPFVALTHALSERFPAFLPYAGEHGPAPVPHLTVAQAEAAELAVAEAELRAALAARGGGVFAQCREFVLIENASGRWRRMTSFALGSAGS